MYLHNDNNSNRDSKPNSIAGYGMLLLVALCCTGCTRKPATADANVQTTFSTPEEASQMLHAAALAHDEDSLARILGPGSKAVLSSGDPAEDKATIDSFVAKYDRMNRWAAMTDGSRVLYLGADNYAFPIPLAHNASSKWYFNTPAGAGEILARRIGRNELLAIDAVSVIANAQEIYFRSSPGSVRQYAQKIISSPGAQDGLYWNAADGQAPSPLDTLAGFGKAAVPNSNAPLVLDGYTFRILTAQGDAAKGGAKSYLSNGRMTGGFAVIASPVKYGDSGMMTFFLNREGIVYQQDLGPRTADAANAIQTYNPADGWALAE